MSREVTIRIPSGRELLLRLTICAYAALALTFLYRALLLLGQGDLLAIAILLPVALAIVRIEHVIEGSYFVSGEFVPIIIAAVIAPRAAPVIALTSILSHCKTHWLRTANVSVFVVAATLAGLAAPHPPTSFLEAFRLASLGGVAFLVANFGLISVCIWLNNPQHLQDALPVFLSTVFATALFAFPIVAGVVYAYERQGFWTLPLILVPLTLVQYFHGLYRKKVVLTEELAVNNRVLARSNLQFAAAMVRALDARDAYTAGHSAAVAVYTRDIARAMGMDDDACTQAHLAGLLHDIGKIGVPGRVLNKRSPLDDEEYELMKQHASIGADILGEVDAYGELATIVRHHHERIDGRGYPDRIAGEHIPSISRMISVADTYSAMTTDRPYRQGLDPEIAMLELSSGKGTQLDSEYVDAFLFILLDASDAYRRGKQSGFETEVAKHEALGSFEHDALSRVASIVPAHGLDDWTDETSADAA